MQLLDQALMEAINRRLVDPDDAYRFAVDKKQFARFVTNSGVVPKLDIAE
jgi:twitching motility protein PilT